MLIALNSGVLDGDSLAGAIMEDGQSNHWHLDKRLNAGHLFTTLSLAAAMIVWAMNIESRIAGHDMQLTSISEQMERTDSRNIRSLESISIQMNRINDKLDRLIERQ